MPGIKVVIGTKQGKVAQKEIAEDQAYTWAGKKLGDHIKGEVFDLPGYEFEISGGSDNCGFPMRKDVTGPGRKKILTVGSTGVKAVGRGIRIRKTVCGNTVSERTAQLNLKILKEGPTPLTLAVKAEKK